MLFNSLHYLIFFPVVVTLHFLLPHKARWALLLAASYYFYMSWKVEYAFLLLFSTSLAYFAGILLEKTESQLRRKAILWTCLLLLLCVLFTFKYYNFAASSLHYLLGKFNVAADFPILNVLLPIGISFYTFQKISYVVDVYYKRTKVEKHFGIFAVYSCFFPQLVAGPIERANHLLPQFYARHDFSYANATDGLRYILWGLFKKVVVADRLALLVQTVYTDPHNYAGLPLIVATLFFAIQIYCDFSGYTDIAIGSAKFIGFDLMANFRQPYFSLSIPEFWRRWHISLSSWFKEYLYIPLGGNRVPQWRWYYNLFITFFISGLWHGANWTFALWGALHGCYMVVDSLIAGHREKWAAGCTTPTSKFLFSSSNMILTLVLVTIAWIPFRAANIGDTWFILTHLFTNATGWLDLGSLAISFRGIGLSPIELLYAVLAIFAVLAIDALDYRTDFWKNLPSKSRLFRWSIYYALLFILLFFAPYNQAQNFIYFQF